MIQVSDRSLLVFVCVVICIFTIERQSESCANMFHASDYFCTIGSVVDEAANTEKAQQKLVLLAT